MKRLIPLALAPIVLAAAPAADPYLWLEDIEGTRALQQVRAWNAETEALLTKSPRFEQDRARAKAILDDEAQIADADAVLGDRVTNLWRDAKNPRGLWRVATLADYQAGRPQWRTLIDVDALGRAEGKSWVWHGASCLEPDYARCLVRLSPGGTDAQVVREFDLTTGRFVDDVSGRLLALRRQADGRWTQTPVALPGNSTLHLGATTGRSDEAFVTVEGMLTPPTLYAVRVGAPPRAVQALPARFDATKYRVVQRFATSRDGTRVPYFLVTKKGATAPAPALIHAYGGFRAAQTPTYLTE